MSTRPPGQVRDAILTVMRDRRGRDMAVAEIHAAVEEKLGGPVAASSIRSYLQLGLKTHWSRVRKGVYRMRG